MRRSRKRDEIPLGDASRQKSFMNTAALVITCAACCLFCACGHNAKSTDVAVGVLDPNKIVGVLPTEVSRVSGNLNRTPSILVGAFSDVDKDRGECRVVIRISPQWSSSTLGNVLVREMSPPTIGKTSGTATVSELHGIVTGPGNTEVLGYFPLSEAFGDSLHEDTEIQLYDKWDSDSTATFAFPVYVCSDSGVFNLRSLMNGSTFHLDEALPEEITGMAMDGQSDAESVPVSSCGIAVFTISEVKTDHEFLVHLLAFLELDKGGT